MVIHFSIVSSASGFDEQNATALSAIPPMLRRRASPLGKLALTAACRCLEQLTPPMLTSVPSIFCSQHGDIGRSIELLDQLAHGEALSPTTFSLSVHNATAGLFSIARGDRAVSSAVAGGEASVENGIIEACSLLADGASHVLLVAYDAPIAPLFATFEEHPRDAFAWAWLLAPAGPNAISLEWQASGPESSAHPDLWSFSQSDARELDYVRGGQRWNWRRGA